MGRGMENESRGNRQQMNLHLCSEASGDGREKTSQTNAEARLWSHASWGLSSLSARTPGCILIFPLAAEEGTACSDAITSQDDSHQSAPFREGERCAAARGTTTNS